MNKLSERMKEALKAKGMTQKELADKLHVSQVTVGRWVLGTREPDLDTLLRICYYLDEDSNYMLGYDVDELAKEEQDEASSRPVSRRSSARRTKRKVRFLDRR